MWCLTMLPRIGRKVSFATKTYSRLYVTRRHKFEIYSLSERISNQQFNEVVDDPQVLSSVDNKVIGAKLYCYSRLGNIQELKKYVSLEETPLSTRVKSELVFGCYCQDKGKVELTEKLFISWLDSYCNQYASDDSYSELRGIVTQLSSDLKNLATFRRGDTTEESSYFHHLIGDHYTEHNLPSLFVWWDLIHSYHSRHAWIQITYLLRCIERMSKSENQHVKQAFHDIMSISRDAISVSQCLDKSIRDTNAIKLLKQFQCKMYNGYLIPSLCFHGEHIFALNIIQKMRIERISLFLSSIANLMSQPQSIGSHKHIFQQRHLEPVERLITSMTEKMIDLWKQEHFLKSSRRNNELQWKLKDGRGPQLSAAEIKDQWLKKQWSKYGRLMIQNYCEFLTYSGRPLEVRRFLNKIRRSIPINYRNKADRKGGIINDFISFGSILHLLKISQGSPTQCMNIYDRLAIDYYFDRINESELLEAYDCIMDGLAQGIPDKAAIQTMAMMGLRFQSIRKKKFSPTRCARMDL